MPNGTTSAPAKMGRPTKYRPEYCEKVLEFGKQGFSFHEIALELDTYVDVLRDWVAKFPEFASAMSRARALSQSWWERQGREGLYDTTIGEGSERVTKRINANLYSLQVRNRFPQDWRDKQDLELSGAGGGPIQLEAMSVEQIRAELAKRGAIQAEVVPNDTPQEPAKICQISGSLVVETGAIEAEIVGENATRAGNVD